MSSEFSGFLFSSEGAFDAGVYYPSSPLDSPHLDDVASHGGFPWSRIDSSCVSKELGVEGFGEAPSQGAVPLDDAKSNPLSGLIVPCFNTSMHDLLSDTGAPAFDVYRVVRPPSPIRSEPGYVGITPIVTRGGKMILDEYLEIPSFHHLADGINPRLVNRPDCSASSSDDVDSSEWEDADDDSEISSGEVDGFSSKGATDPLEQEWDRDVVPLVNKLDPGIPTSFDLELKTKLKDGSLPVESGERLVVYSSETRVGHEKRDLDKRVAALEALLGGYGTDDDSESDEVGCGGEGHDDDSGTDADADGETDDEEEGISSMGTSRSISPILFADPGEEAVLHQLARSAGFDGQTITKFSYNESLPVWIARTPPASVDSGGVAAPEVGGAIELSERKAQVAAFSEGLEDDGGEIDESDDSDSESEEESDGDDDEESDADDSYVSGQSDEEAISACSPLCPDEDFVVPDEMWQDAKRQLKRCRHELEIEEEFEFNKRRRAGHEILTDVGQAERFIDTFTPAGHYEMHMLDEIIPRSAPLESYTSMRVETKRGDESFYGPLF